RTQPSAEAGARAGPEAQRGEAEAVQPVDAGDLEPCDAVQRVDEADQEDEPDAEDEGQADAGAQERAEGADDARADDAEGGQFEKCDDEAQPGDGRRIGRRGGGHASTLGGRRAPRYGEIPPSLFGFSLLAKPLLV